MRILLVSFYFAPYNSVGAVRPTRLAELLEQLGNEVYVLSAAAQPYPEGLQAALPPDRVSRTPWRNVNAPVDWLLGGRRVAEHGYPTSRGRGGLSRLGALYRGLVHFPDAQAGWYRAAVREGRRMLARHPFDVIYVSAPPFTGLAVGAVLARESGVPWVAEFRDLWTDNHNYRYGAVRRRLEAALEARVLRSARAFVTVSPELAQKLERRHRQPVAVVANGFDADEMAALDEERAAPGSELELVYTGSIYEGAYDIDSFLRALDLLGEARAAVRLRFFGRGHGELPSRVRHAGLERLFSFAPTVPRAEALRRQRSADVLLFLCWTGPQAEGVLSSKIFEYIGARRPILGIGDPGRSAGRLVLEQGGFVSRDPAAIAAWLRERVAAKRALGREPDRPLEAVARFSRAYQARGLDAFLRRLAAVPVASEAPA